MKRPKLPVTDWFRTDAYHPALPGFYECGKADGHISCAKRYWDGRGWLMHPGGDSPSLYMQDPKSQWRGVRMWVLVRTPLQPGSAPVFCIDPAAELPGWSRLATDATPYKTRATAMRAAARYHRLLDLQAVLV